MYVVYSYVPTSYTNLRHREQALQYHVDLMLSPFVHNSTQNLTFVLVLKPKVPFNMRLNVRWWLEMNERLESDLIQSLYTQLFQHRQQLEFLYIWGADQSKQVPQPQKTLIKSATVDYCRVGISLRIYLFYIIDCWISRYM